MSKRSPKVRDTKERILDAALALFGDRGYQAVTMDDVAARAGVTKGAVYYYFHDKDDLGRDLQRRLWNRLQTEALEAFDPSLGTIENLKRCFDVYLRSLRDLDQARFFLRDSWAVPALDVAGRQDQEVSVSLVRVLLEEGARRGEVAPVDTEALARVLIAAFAEATLHVLTTGRPEPAVEVVRRVVDAFAVGKRSSPGSRKRRETVTTGRGR